MMKARHGSSANFVKRLGFEYDYSAFETKNYQLAGAPGGTYAFDAKPRDIQSAVVRLSYKF
jgi:outer membrane immunogenic protein